MLTKLTNSSVWLDEVVCFEMSHCSVLDDYIHTTLKHNEPTTFVNHVLVQQMRVTDVCSGKGPHYQNN